MATETEIIAALRRVEHPELKRSLIDLCMIEDVRLENGHAILTLVLPYLQVPIREDLVRAIEGAVQTISPDLSVHVGLREMNQRERAAFTAKAEAKPDEVKPTNEIHHVVAVLSGKGGVGKSSVAALLAVNLRLRGQRVGLLDADITGPSIPKMFGLHERPTAGREGIRPIRTAQNIAVMSMNLLLADENEAVIWRGPLISSAIKQFWREVAWGTLDYLVVDLPPGTSDASLTVMQSIPLSGVVLVTSPQDLAGMVVRKAARMVQHLSAPILGLVENMSYVICPRCGERIEVFGPSGTEAMAAELGIPFLGRVPLDPEFASHCDAGEVERYGAELLAPAVEALVHMLSTG